MQKEELCASLTETGTRDRMERLIAIQNMKKTQCKEET